MMELSGHDQEVYRRYATARDYLTSQGIKTLDRYWKNPEGTIEIVAAEGNELVVVVLQDTGSTSIPPRHARQRQRRMAVAWMKANSVSFPRIRVDVVSVHLLPMGQSNLEHVRAVVHERDLPEGYDWVWQNVTDLYVDCAFRVRNHGAPGFAASDCCRAPADSAVLTPDGSKMWRCPGHRGLVTAGQTGEVMFQVLYPRLRS